MAGPSSSDLQKIKASLSSCSCSLVTKSCLTLELSWIVAHQTPLSMGFTRQEYWSGLPFPSPGDLPDPGNECPSPVVAGRFFTTEPPRRPNITIYCCCCSVPKSCPTLCDPHGLQNTMFPCLSLSPRVCSNLCLLSQWCHPIISSSVVPFSSCPLSFPVWRPFPVSQLYASGSQSIRASASVSVLLMNIEGWFPLGLTSLILQLKGLSRVFFSTTVGKHQFFGTQPSFVPTTLY